MVTVPEAALPMVSRSGSAYERSIENRRVDIGFCITGGIEVHRRPACREFNYGVLHWRSMAALPPFRDSEEFCRVANAWVGHLLKREILRRQLTGVLDTAGEGPAKLDNVVD